MFRRSEGSMIIFTDGGILQLQKDMEMAMAGRSGPGKGGLNGGDVVKV